MSAPLVHGLVAVAGILAYTLLTALHQDGNAVLVAALAYGSGASAQKLSS